MNSGLVSLRSVKVSAADPSHVRKAPIINALALARKGHIFISTFSIAQEDEEGLKISRPHEGSYRRYADTDWV